MGIAGPTSGPGVPVFQWNESTNGSDDPLANIIHSGQAKRFDFQWELMEMGGVNGGK